MVVVGVPPPLCCTDTGSYGDGTARPQSASFRSVRHLRTGFHGGCTRTPGSPQCERMAPPPPPIPVLSSIYCLLTGSRSNWSYCLICIFFLLFVFFLLRSRQGFSEKNPNSSEGHGEQRQMEPLLVRKAPAEAMRPSGETAVLSCLVCLKIYLYQQTVVVYIDEVTNGTMTLRM